MVGLRVITQEMMNAVGSQWASSVEAEIVSGGQEKMSTFIGTQGFCWECDSQGKELFRSEAAAAGVQSRNRLENPIVGSFHTRSLGTSPSSYPQGPHLPLQVLSAAPGDPALLPWGILQGIEAGGLEN